MSQQQEQVGKISYRQWVRDYNRAQGEVFLRKVAAKAGVEFDPKDADQRKDLGRRAHEILMGFKPKPKGRKRSKVN